MTASRDRTSARSLSRQVRDKVPEQTAGGLSAPHARRLVIDIAKRYFGEKPRRIVQRGGGLSNLVFEFHAAGGDYVVRMHAEPGRINHYLKEQWAMTHAQAQGVPTADVLEVDIEAAELPYMVSRKIDGRDATTHPQRLEIIREVGRLAALVHRAPTHGYGKVFDWSSNQLSHCASWREYLDSGLDVQACVAALTKARLLTPGQLAELHEIVEAMRKWRKPPVLNHGDLRLKNVIVAQDSAQVLALIDWDESLSAPAPYWDLSIALHDLNLDEKEAFLDGYGMTPRNYAKILPFMRAINILNYGRVVAQLLLQKDKSLLTWYRARLQGQFDLFLTGTR